MNSALPQSSDRPTTVAPMSADALWTLAGAYISEITGGALVRFPAHSRTDSISSLLAGAT